MARSTYQPNTHIRSDLIVPASTSVQLASNVLADNLGQAAFVGGVNILVVRLDLELVYQLSPPVAAPASCVAWCAIRVQA